MTGPVTIPLLGGSGLGPIEVTAISDRTVRMVAPLTGAEFSSDGGCSSTFTGPGANTSAHMDLTCHAGEKAVVNMVSLEVAGIGDEGAVIRIRPVN
ncbi:hypothetical protein [Actinomadura sp. 3N407]|uniref:hypothetical protein n=1 Tax=Actinomadura sp. 3N407 TaxID=3457423 RepID=UPI003FCC2F79